jgi:hypothetical protein
VKNNELLYDALANLKPGDRVILAFMGDDPDPIAPGSLGTVADIEPCVRDNEVQVFVKWDNGRALSCICPPDVLIPYPANIADTKTKPATHLVGDGSYEFRWSPVAGCDGRSATRIEPSGNPD